MLDQESRQAIVDSEHLRLLSVAYIISGVMTALLSVMGLFYAAMGLLVSTIAQSPTNSSTPDSVPPQFMGLFFAVFGGIFFLAMISLAIAKFKAASYLKNRRSRTFCMVVAGISCLGVPYGTCLGVCTFMVLGRQSVSDSFGPATVA
jgi:hypothetical protein